MPNRTQKYYLGVVSRLKTEFQSLNNLIPHNLTKGMSNEKSLSNIIKKYLPSAYNLGSGIVVDTFDNNSSLRLYK